MNIASYLQQQKQICLTEQQQRAISSDSRYILLLAVPGSGKTTVLVSRIAELMVNRAVPAEQILTLTFSRESARDMKRRFEGLFHSVIFESPRFSTIHSFCYTILKFYSEKYHRTFPELLAETGSGLSRARLLREIYQQENHEYLSDDLLEALGNSISLAKNLMLQQCERKRLDTPAEHFCEIYERYERVKQERGWMDFDDILLFALKIMQKKPLVLQYFQKRYPYINVDEAQDTSRIQYEIIRMLTEHSTEGLFVVGDEDQCIYGFRGAYPDGLTQFDKTYPQAEILKIEQNFRSHSDIVNEADRFIRINKNRYQKQMYSDNQQEHSIFFLELPDYSAQYQQILQLIQQLPKGKTLAVLYRNNESAVPLLDLLDRNQIEYYRKEQNLRFFTSFVVKDIMSFFTLSYCPQNIEAFERIYYKCGCSKATLIYVKYNISSYGSVFEAASACPDTPVYVKKKMLEYHRMIPTLREKRPLAAILFVENRLGYGEYLSRRASSGMNSVNSSLKLNILKTIARNYTDIELFVERLLELENQFKQRKTHRQENSVSVTLSSIHSSKGLEFDTVVLIDLIETILPDQQAIEALERGETAPMEGEARLFYVAMTRAREQLITYYSKYCNDELVVKSRFVTRLMPEKQAASDPRTQIAVPTDLKGKEVIHRFFGAGRILEQYGTVLEIEFFKHGIKQLCYQSCMENHILKVRD